MQDYSLSVKNKDFKKTFFRLECGHYEFREKTKLLAFAVGDCED